MRERHVYDSAGCQVLEDEKYEGSITLFVSHYGDRLCIVVYLWHTTERYDHLCRQLSCWVNGTFDPRGEIKV
jgi:hypothetical protein